MVKKTIITGLVTGIMVLSVLLTACGSATPKGSGNASAPTEITLEEAGNLGRSLDGATEFVKRSVDVSGMEFFSDTTDPAMLYGGWLLSEPAKNEELSKEITINGNYMALGTTKESELQVLDYDIDAYGEMIDPNTITSVTLSKNGLQFLLELEENKTDAAVPIGDLRITGFNSGIKDYALPFAYMGFTQDSTFEDAVRIFGTPNGGINMSADTTGTIITLTYDHEIAADMPQLETLNIDFAYDAETDTAAFLSIRYTGVAQ